MKCYVHIHNTFRRLWVRPTQGKEYTPTSDANRPVGMPAPLCKGNFTGKGPCSLYLLERTDVGLSCSCRRLVRDQCADHMHLLACGKLPAMVSTCLIA
jgi:hypothetical protein